MERYQLVKSLSLFLLLIMGTVTLDYESWEATADSSQNDWNLHETHPEAKSVSRDCTNKDAYDLDCPTDGQWSPWKSWSACQGKCGRSGERVRYRSCDDPAPARGGAPCIGSSYEQEQCPIVECRFARFLLEAENGKLTSKETRLLRYLQVKHNQYIGLAEKFDSPNADISDVASVISQFDYIRLSYESDMYWAAAVCLKYNTECPEEGKWSQWTDWGPCNALCGGGISIRTRECLGAAHPELDCIGSPFEITACSTHPCPPYAVHAFDWSTWSPWQGCQPFTCNTRHFKYREHCCQEKNNQVLRSVPTNPVLRPAAARAKAESRHERPAEIEIDFLPARQDRESDAFLVPVNPKNAQIDKSRNVNSNAEVLPTTFGVSSLFSLRRIRRFIAEESEITHICQPTPSHFVCVGPSFEVEECETENSQGCNGNPFWSSWSEWSCSVICGIGQSRRWRACLARNMASPTQWTSCPGPYVEDSSCFPRPCNPNVDSQAVFDGESSSIWYASTNKSAQMFRVYVKLKPESPEGTILWRAPLNQCHSPEIKCLKALQLALKGGHVYFKAIYKKCSLELLSEEPIRMNKWNELSVSVVNWIGILRIASSPVIVYSNFSCEDRSDVGQSGSPNWDTRTTIDPERLNKKILFSSPEIIPDSTEYKIGSCYARSINGKANFFGGAISHLAINFESWPLSPFADETGTPDNNAFHYMDQSHNVQITDGDWDEDVKHIAPDESVLIYPDKGSSLLEFSLAFKTQSTEGLVLTIQGDDGVIPLFYKIFLESSYFHLLFQCFQENLNLIQAQEYPECFVEETNPYTILPDTWYFLSIEAHASSFNLTINAKYSVQLKHIKKFSFQYISIGWSKSSEREGSQDLAEAAKGVWEKPMQLSIAEFELSDNAERPRPIRLDEMPVFENNFASIVTSSVSERYTELLHAVEDPLTLSCELPITSFEEQDKVIWTKSDQVIASQSDSEAVELNRAAVVVENRNTDEEVLISVLTLTPRTASDSGFYSCILVRQGKSTTLQAFGITIVEVDEQQEAEQMAVADSSSFYITIAVIVVGAVFLLLVVCGSGILLYRRYRNRRKPKEQPLSLMVNASSDDESTLQEVLSKQERRNSRRSSAPSRSAETFLNTTINMESDAEETDSTTAEPTDMNSKEVEKAPNPRRVSFSKKQPSPSESQATLQVSTTAKIPETEVQVNAPVPPPLSVNKAPGQETTTAASV